MGFRFWGFGPRLCRSWPGPGRLKEMNKWDRLYVLAMSAWAFLSLGIFGDLGDKNPVIGFFIWVAFVAVGAGALWMIRWVEIGFTKR